MALLWWLWDGVVLAKVLVFYSPAGLEWRKEEREEKRELGADFLMLLSHPE